MKKQFFNNITYISLVRWWLTGMLFFIPFQNMIVKGIELWSNGISVWVNRLDEITIIVFVLLAIREFYKNREIFGRLHLILLSPILVLGISGLISGIVNGNSLFVTIYGIFDYIKILLVIFIYAAFFRDFTEFKKIFRLLLIVAVFLGAVAFIQELWAMGSRYILEKDIQDRGIYILRNLLTEVGHGYFKGFWRLGIYRAPSLMAHPNSVGFYSLLILTIYFCIKKKVNFAVVAALLTGIFASVSRLVYAGFVFIAGVQIFKGRRWLIALIAIPMVILLFSKSPVSKFDMTEGQKQRGFITYRVYARDKAIEIWKDHAFWGVGPGMFGGMVSVKYWSPVYDEYSFSRAVKPILKQYKNLDQFWPQVLAEMGIIGTVAFAGFFITLFITFFMLRQRAVSDEMRGLFTGLAIYIIVIFIYTLGTVLNVIPVLFTYCAFVGIGLGCSNKHRDNN